MNYSTVRAAIASVVTAGVTDNLLNCYGYMPNMPEIPAFCVAGMDIEPNVTMRARDQALITCYVFVSTGDDLEGQKLLDGYLSRTGASSIRAALFAAPTLSGACESAVVTRVGGYRMYDMPDGTQLFGAVIDIRVIGGTS
jgi:hypothetical protein